MEDINVFLAHAVELEREAARRYEELVEIMKAGNNKELESFFKQMAVFSRKHLAQAVERGGFHQLPAMAAQEYNWPDGISPEQFEWVGVDALIDVNTALSLALNGEKRSQEFYAGIAASTSDPEVKAMAEEFADEEMEHVQALESWINRQAAMP